MYAKIGAFISRRLEKRKQRFAVTLSKQVRQQRYIQTNNEYLKEVMCKYIDLFFDSTMYLLRADHPMASRL